MADTLVTRVAYPNYSGMLFCKGNTRTPFSTLIGANPLYTNATKFSTGVSYNAAVGTQPAITEKNSFVAPDSIATGRVQGTNVTQIFQYAVNVGYAKEADFGQLSGVNLANAQANPQSELDFQIARAMDKAAMDLEYTFMKGTYSDAGMTDVEQANTTRGMLEAITTNVIQAGSTATALTYWKVAEAMKCIREQGGDTSNLVLGVSAAALLQLNKDASDNQYLQGIVTIAGLNLQTVVTPLGNVSVVLLDTLNPTSSEQTNTAVIFDPSAIHPVFQNVPNRGCFFLEQLAKVGASDRYQIFGMAGLDYGCEAYSAKITNISNALPTGTL